MANQKKRAKNNFEIIISDQAKKSLKKIDSRYHKKIKQKIIALSVDPFSVGKKLDGRYSGLYSLRAWPYRIIYSVIKNKLVVTVIEIEHRQEVYKK
ncbi:type II toxin-antitoxin system RelE/ParE family toxin [Patescibacteria group bacterium]|nr:type II toxin-antitoxin system RelE/ParE family toxin [Patescibacteria group bacterium]